MDKKSDASLVVPNRVEDLQALLDYPEYMNYSTPIFGEASADDYYVLDETFDLFQGRIDADAYIWNPVDYFFPNDWSAAYFPIHTANICLERIENIPRTSQNEIQWNNVKGSALFYRAYYFLNLVWTFSQAYDPSTSTSDLGIVLRLGTDFNEASVRSTVEETYQQILKDLYQALNYLPPYPEHVMRPSQAAVYGVLAKTYLSMRQYDSAGKYSNLCLSMNSDLLDFNDPAEVNVNSNTPFPEFNKEIVFYSEVTNVFLVMSHSSRMLVDTALYDSYQSNDLRKKAYFRSRTGGYGYKSLYAGGRMFSGIATDDMYLIRAECYARQNKTDLALADLNALLSKRYESGAFVPVDAATASEVLEIILLERRKELFHRGGNRWMDLKRLNKEGAGITLTRKVKNNLYTLAPNDSKYALPLPKDIIEQTGMPQN